VAPRAARLFNAHARTPARPHARTPARPHDPSCKPQAASGDRNPCVVRANETDYTRSREFDGANSTMPRDMHPITKSIALLALVIATASVPKLAESAGDDLAERAAPPGHTAPAQRAVLPAASPRLAAADAPAAAPATELPAFPVRPPPDPARVSSGRALFSVNCSFCHGANAKGGETGPNLVRSAIVLDDKDGEKIARIVTNGIPGKGMPNFSLSSSEIGAIAAFIHSIPVGEHALDTPATVNSLVGDPKAGAMYFAGSVGKCTSCHSVTGDLQHVGSKFGPRDLQSALVAGGLRDNGLASFFASPLYIPPGTTASVTLGSGVTHSGLLQHIDEFIVSIVDSKTGYTMTFPRSGASPAIELHVPIQAHLDLLRVYTDADIHNLTAYLATLK
jgi:cytochrome c oxidase cbb3-type subunit 3